MRAIRRRFYSLTMFLADGLRRVDKAGWNVHAIVCPRSCFLDVRTSEEFPQPGVPGVYVLSSPCEEGAIPTIYIGQSDQLRRRLTKHFHDPKKDFWTSLIVFTSRSKNFTTAHAEYLESQLISLAKKVKRCFLSVSAKGRVQNNQQLRMLPPADEAAMDVFLKEMLLICDLLDLTAFEGPPRLIDVPPAPKKLR